jgi:hypothetical protein
LKPRPGRSGPRAAERGPDPDRDSGPVDA